MPVIHVHIYSECECEKERKKENEKHTTQKAVGKELMQLIYCGQNQNIKHSVLSASFHHQVIAAL